MIYPTLTYRTPLFTLCSCVLEDLICQGDLFIWSSSFTCNRAHATCLIFKERKKNREKGNPGSEDRARTAALSQECRTLKRKQDRHRHSPSNPIVMHMNDVNNIHAIDTHTRTAWSRVHATTANCNVISSSGPLQTATTLAFGHHASMHHWSVLNKSMIGAKLDLCACSVVALAARSDPDHTYQL